MYVCIYCSKGSVFACQLTFCVSTICVVAVCSCRSNELTNNRLEGEAVNLILHYLVDIQLLVHLFKINFIQLFANVFLNPSQCC